MTKNPFINAAAASLYIIVLSSAIFYAQSFHLPEPSVFMPIIMLSFLTLSAVVMGTCFLYQPLQLYLDGKKKVAVNLFLQTLASFAGITALIIVLVFSRILK